MVDRDYIVQFGHDPQRTPLAAVGADLPLVGSTLRLTEDQVQVSYRVVAVVIGIKVKPVPIMINGVEHRDARQVGLTQVIVEPVCP